MIRVPICSSSKRTATLNSFFNREVPVNRRSFMSLPGALALGALTSSGRDLELESAVPVPGKGLRLSITWGMLGKISVSEGLAMLDRMGYDAFEMIDWRNQSLL